MSGITPGKWWHSNLEVGSGPLMLVKVARVSGANYDEATANANAIAAIPLMLEALRSVKSSFAYAPGSASEPDWFAKVRIADEAATGGKA